MTNLARRPLVPEDRNAYRPATYLQRACLAHAIAATAHVDHNVPTKAPEAAAVADRRWNDGVTELVLRGAAVPATTTAPSWAGVLAQEAVGDFVASLEPLSAGAKLLNACPRVSFDRMAMISFPRRDGPTAPVGHWVAEGTPIPNPKFSLQAALLGPTKTSPQSRSKRARRSKAAPVKRCSRHCCARAARSRST